MNGTTTLPRRSFGETDASRRLVDSTAPRVSRIVDLHRLFHLGRVSGTELFFWQLHLAVLFAGNFWRIRRTAGSGRNPLGGQPGFCFLRRC